MRLLSRTKTVRAIMAVLVVLCFVVPDHLPAQSFNGQIGGIVQDATNALIPGATITLTGQQTGVVTTTITNESGAYNFPSVLPGVYRLRAELPGFRPSTITDVQVGGAAQLRLNFTLEIGALTESVEVSVTSQALLTESSATVGEVLPQSRVRELPIVGMDALSLISILPGVEGDSFAGVTSLQVNTVRDGLSVSDGRANNGVFGTTVINPDLVGEIRLILTPVDAELGRGNAQVQITTRSGTNRYTGSAVWNVRNSGLDANTWDNNRNINSSGAWEPLRPNWENNHSVTLSYGGPILRNKTFFFALYEQQANYRRELITAPVMTNEARQGIFRYFDNWNPGNALTAIPNFPASATNGTYPAVDFAGRPVAPPLLPSGAPYTGSLRCYSVFGNVKFDGSPFTQADCPGGVAMFPSSSTSWDTLRPVADATGYIRKVMDRMPEANYFASGDGLNLAAFQWVRHRKGAGGAGISTGTDQSTDRKQINIKIDQNINSSHRASVGWTYERNDGFNDISNWPDGLSYGMRRDPHVLTANFTSTISPTVLNEARFGIRVTRYTPTAPWEKEDTRQLAEEFILPGAPGHRAVINPGAGAYAFGTTNGVFAASPTQYVGVSAPLFTYSDTVSLTRGVHAFKFGGEYRTQSGVGYNNFPCTCPLPRVTGGAGDNPSTLSNAGPAGALQTGRTNATNMLYFLAGSVSNATMLYWIEGEKNMLDGTWVNYTQGKKTRDIVEKEWAFFAKDDWKATRNLTLNLGVRWEYYAPPYIANGLTTTTVGGGAGLFGVSRNSSGDLFGNWLQPGNVFLTGYGSSVAAANALRCTPPACDPNLLTRMEFIGPETSQPDKHSIRPDRNNFGPAVGFSWQVPWFGEGRTTVRGGYQITFGGSGRLSGGANQADGSTENLFANVPGSTSHATTIGGDFGSRYLDLRDVPVLVPVRPSSPALPGGSLEIYIPYTGVLDAMDPNYTTPYTQNYNLSVTRNINRFMTVDVRYVGTVSKKLRGNFDINMANVYYNPELFEALEITRRGDDAELFDQMFAGLNVSGQTTGGYGAVGTVVSGRLQRGSAHLRRNQTFTSNLANGNFFAVAASLAALNTAQNNGPLQPLPAGLTGVGRRVLRNGCDRIANGLTAIPTRCFPENYLQMNPQLGSANPASRYVTNSGSSNYHSMQAQFTLRPVSGFNFQGTYTWARNMVQPGGGFTDPLNRRADYNVSGRAHDFRANGGFELPIGPNKLLLGNASGWLARLTERWQANMIFQMGSGNRGSITASNMFYANGRADVVGPWNVSGGDVQWGTGLTGNYFNNVSFATVPDPQCAAISKVDSMGFNLADNCTLDAITDASTGQILLQHPQPGRRGSLGSQTVVLPGFRSFDANVQKSFSITESKTLSFRMDATNVLNSPDVDNPTLAITSANFGQIGGKGNSRRQYQGQIRLTF